MRRFLQTAFSVFLIVAGGYFFVLYLQHPASYGLWRNALPSVFWIGLGAFLLWNDYVRRAPPTGKKL